MNIRRTAQGILIEHHGPLRGATRPPGSKSHTNRCLLMAALADGVSQLDGASFADDARIMLAGIEALGIRVETDEAVDRLLVHGCAGHIPANEAALDAGAAGTAMRFLTALCALGHGSFQLDGTQRMRARPIGVLVDALNSLGAQIDYQLERGFPPLRIRAGGLGGGRVVIEQLSSSQFLSALLMVAPLAVQDVFVDVRGALPSRPYVDLTTAAMREFGVEVLCNDAQRWIVPGSQRYQAANVAIEADASAAAYFWAGAAITAGSVLVRGLSRSSLQGDVGFVDVLAQMGCRIAVEGDGIRVCGPEVGALRGIDIDLNAMPDTVQTLAVAALFANGPTTIRNVANLRIKETDRLEALRTELTKLGADIQLTADDLTINPPRCTRQAEIDTYDDHRMAMSFALCGLRQAGVLIRDSDCVSKSFPGYFDALAKLS